MAATPKNPKTHDTEAATPQTEAVDDTRKSDDREQRIREVAYFIWQEEGCPEDQADRHWAAAEAVVYAQDEDRKNAREGSAGRAPHA